MISRYKAGFPLGEFNLFARTEKSKLIGWRKTLTTSPPKHIRFLLVGAKKSPSGKRALRISNLRRSRLELIILGFEMLLLKRACDF